MERQRTVIILTVLAAVLGTAVLATTVTGEDTSDRADIIVISVNSLRADHLSCYGYERNTTPNICSLADDGLLYQDTTAQHYWTTPSETSILTGLHPEAHGVTLKPTRGNITPLPDTAQTLPEVLGDHGYETTARVPIDQWVFPDGGNLLQDFETVHNQTGIRTIVDDIINDSSPRPAFTYAHTKNLHRPYQIPPPVTDRYTDPYNGTLDRFVDNGWMEYNTLYNTSHRNGSYVLNTGNRTLPLSEQDLAYVRDRYDTVVKLVDHDIGRLITALKQQGRYDDTILVVTAPHGETLAGPYDAGFGHREPYPPVLKVPLIIKPAGVTEPRSVNGLVELIDLYPTLLDIVGIQPPEMVQGRSRVRSAETATHAFSAGTRVQTADWIYLGETDRRGPALYHRDEDPEERSDVRSSNPDIADALRSQLHNHQEDNTVLNAMLRSGDQ